MSKKTFIAEPVIGTDDRAPRRREVTESSIDAQFEALNEAIADLEEELVAAGCTAKAEVSVSLGAPTRIIALRWKHHGSAAAWRILFDDKPIAEVTLAMRVVAMSYLPALVDRALEERDAVPGKIAEAAGYVEAALARLRGKR